jgi:ribosomal protein S18 acetylase RimI-like enzyme
MLVAILTDVRQLLGPRRHSTIVFDRGGWSPKLFRNLLDMGFDILTYRKGRSRRIAATRFSPHQAKLDGRAVRYLLQDQPVRFLKGKLRLRQVTRLTDDGHQTPIVTSRWDLRAIVIAYRMFERWRQENFFKYLRQEYLIDALVDYQVEPDDPTRLVPNPARKALDKELRLARASFTKLQERFGVMALDYVDRDMPQADFQKTEKKLRRDMEKVTVRIQKLETQRASLPSHLPLAKARKGQDTVKLSTERKHLTNILKMVAFQIESDLVEMIRPHYKRAEDEGRTLVQTIL